MRKPVWRHDWAGFSGGWYGDVDQINLTVLGCYHFSYTLDVTAPLVGDLRVGYQMKLGRENPRQSPSRTGRRFIWERRSLKELRAIEAEAQQRNADLLARVERRRNLT